MRTFKSVSALHVNMGVEKDAQIVVRVDAETKALIADQLEYGDSMSVWVREAIEQRIENEGLRGSKNQMMAAD